MAIVGSWIDKTSLVSLSGAVGLSTLSHSLGTTPDEIRIQLRSINSASYALPLAEGGNASLLTIGTGGGNATVAFNVVATYWWQPIR